MEVEEEFFHSIQNRRKKKVLDKKIHSMCEIQDCVLSTKEEKRGIGVRKEKGKAATMNDERIANLLLFDSNISNRTKVILGEAKRTWEVWKNWASVCEERRRLL